MSNLRIVYDNASDRATITASSTAGSLVVSNLQTDMKSKIWRSTSTTATLTVVFDQAEIVGCVALPFCSLTSEATIRVRGYTLATDPSPSLDTGVKLAAGGASFDALAWGSVPLGVNAYMYGSKTYGSIWFTQGTYEKLVIDIEDDVNPLGYIEASRLVIGAYWSPLKNAEYGVELNLIDNSRNERSDSGDLRTDRGIMYKTMSFDLSMMDYIDRNMLFNIVRNNGTYKPVFLSLTPEADDPTEEQIYQIYGKLPSQTSIRYQFINQFNSKIDIEEV